MWVSKTERNNKLTCFNIQHAAVFHSKLLLFTSSDNSYRLTQIIMKTDDDFGHKTCNNDDCSFLLSLCFFSEFNDIESIVIISILCT